MTTFIRCPSCNFCISKYLEFFDLVCNALYQEEVFGSKSKVADYDPDKLALNPGSVPDLEQIFDALGIEKRCCRMRMFSKVDFDNMYR